MPLTIPDLLRSRLLVRVLSESKSASIAPAFLCRHPLFVVCLQLLSGCTGALHSSKLSFRLVVIGYSFEHSKPRRSSRVLAAALPLQSAKYHPSQLELQTAELTTAALQFRLVSLVRGWTLLSSHATGVADSALNICVHGCHRHRQQVCSSGPGAVSLRQLNLFCWVQTHDQPQPDLHTS